MKINILPSLFSLELIPLEICKILMQFSFEKAVSFITNKNYFSKYKINGDVFRVMVMTIGNRIGNPNPGQDGVSLCANAHGEGMNPSVLSPAMNK